MSKKIFQLYFPLNDLELPILADQKERFEALGVSVIVSSPYVIEVCFDKWKTYEFASSIGLNVPTYLSFIK